MINSISINTIYKHPNQLEFNKQCWCIQEQYWRYLGNFNIGIYKKIIVEVDNNISLIGLDNKVEESAINVLVVNKYFDILKFLDLSKIEKKKSLLELLHSSMIYLAELFNWETETLINAYNLCIRNNLNYIFKVKNKDFKSPTKEFIGYVECNWDIEEFTATAVISSSHTHNMVKQAIIIKCEPHLAEFIYYTICKWESNTDFGLIAKDGRKWSISLLSIA